jgi:hypothetical protein
MLPCNNWGVNELEANIQSGICEYLEMRRHFFTRINNIPAFNEMSMAPLKCVGCRSTPRKGMSDILVVHVGRPYFLEVKRPKTYQSPEQKAFQAEVAKAGALYAVVRSIDDVRTLGL